ncbi:hypothetical protein [Pelagibius sp.]|uniref:hypothetical protein n=1 Tax=Pelagibius sp. TaxID=1931238 RepID=UPI00260FBEC3|nr:hypothetical protein [Pelagibius sp.]
MKIKGFVCLTALLAAVFVQDTALQAQPAARTDAKAVTSVSYQEVQQALAEAGVLDVRLRTVDPNAPSFSGRHSQAVTLQATLHACDTAAQRCRGVDLTALIPATSHRNTQAAIGVIDRVTFGIDAKRVDIENRPGATAVMLSTYLVYDHGVSDRLLSVVLDQLDSVISQSKALMLRGDPAHADLWARPD